MNNNLSDIQAFQAMSCFLEKYYDRTASEDLGALLGEMQLLEDGSTADPAAWHDWIECIKTVDNP